MQQHAGSAHGASFMPSPNSLGLALALRYNVCWAPLPPLAVAFSGGVSGKKQKTISRSRGELKIGEIAYPDSWKWGEHGRGVERLHAMDTLAAAWTAAAGADRNAPCAPCHQQCATIASADTIGTAK